MTSRWPDHFQTIVDSTDPTVHGNPRQTIQAATKSLLVKMIHATDKELDIHDPVGVSTEEDRLGFNIYRMAYPAPGDRERKLYDRIMAEETQGLFERVIQQVELGQADPAVLNRIHNSIDEELGPTSDSAWAIEQWARAEADLFQDIHVGVLQRGILSQIEQNRPAALEKAFQQTIAALNHVFWEPVPLAVSLGLPKMLGIYTQPGKGLTVGIVGIAWNLNHKTFQNTKIERLGTPQKKYSKRVEKAEDTACLSLLGGAPTELLVGDERVQVGIAGLLSHAHFRLYTLDSGRPEALEKLLKLAIRGLKAGNILVIPRVQREKMIVNDKHLNVELPLDANPTISKLLREAVEKKIHVIIPAGRSSLDLDEIAKEESFSSVGKSGALIVSVDQPDYNYGSQVSVSLPDQIIRAAGISGISLEPSAPYIDQWKGEYQACMVTAGFLGLLKASLRDTAPQLIKLILSGTGDLGLEGLILQSKNLEALHVVANRRNKELHDPGCAQIRRITQKNRIPQAGWLNWFEIYMLFGEGYDGCGRCLPGYHNK